MGIASDLNNPNFSGATDPDSVMHVKFYMKSIHDTYQSEKEGRPIFFEIPYVQIMTPGNALNIVDTPAREEHKYRFPKHWAIFQNSQAEVQIVGTPVEQWPMITRSQAEDLKGLKFYSVEQIAGASDEQIQRLGMNANMLRQKARAFLDTAKNTAIAQSSVTELAKRDQEIADLKNMVNLLAGKVQELQSSPKSEELNVEQKESNRKK
jgi:hypothetical protein